MLAKQINAIVAVWILLIISFFLFVHYYNEHSSSKIKSNITRHAEVVESSLWSYNRDAPLSYLQFAMQSDGYQSLIITDTYDEIFMELTSKNFSKLDEFLVALKLLPKHYYTTRIYHNEKEIGKLSVTWLNKSTYEILVYLLIWLLVGAGITLLVRLLYTKQALLNKSIELEDSKKLSEIANKAKSEFLANMSHEIRTPMNAIMGLTNLSLERNLNSELRSDLEKVSYSANHLLGIINNILDISKIESGKLEVYNSPFSMDQVLTNLKSICGVRSAIKGINFVVFRPDNIPAYLYGDELKFNQILINICGNAIKFTNQGEVQLIFKMAQLNEDSICLNISVTDTGIGMTESHMERIFNAFEQADTTTSRQFGGTGLGLSISSHLVKLMGGSIKVSSELDKGSQFDITLPFKIADEEQFFNVQPLGADNEIYDFSQYRVLIAEDNKINQHVVKSILQQTGLQIDFADDGMLAIQMIKSELYDAVLMDIQMPNVDGIQATKEIRMLDNFKNLPIIAMTANAMNEDIEICLNAGMNDHVSKPIDKEILFSALAKWLNLNKPLNPQITPELPMVSSLQSVEPDELDINWKAGLKRLSGNKTLYITALETFLLDHRNDGKRLHDFYVNNDRNAFNELIHTLKSVSGNLSINRLFEIVSHINDSIHADPQTNVDIDSFLIIYSSAVRAVEKAIHDHK